MLKGDFPAALQAIGYPAAMPSEIAATHGVDVVMIAESAQFGHLNP
jgi:hypothetical protein